MHYSSIAQVIALAKLSYSSSDTPLAYNSDAHYVYIGNDEVTQVVIPGGTVQIPAGAFYRWNRATSVSIPNSVQTISERAFSGWSSMTSVNIPSSVTTIGNNAFEYCGLTGSIVIPSSVVSLGSDAFANCSGITQAEYTIINRAHIFTNCAGIHTLVLRGRAVYSNGYSINDTLNGMNGLQNIYVDYIETYLSLFSGTYFTYTAVPFYGNGTGKGHLYVGGVEISEVIAPEGTLTIGAGAFQSIDKITYIDLPSTITEIGRGAFMNSRIETIIIRAATPPTLRSSVGYEAINYTADIYVPYGCKSVYEANTLWAHHSSQIKELDENGNIPE